jgi:transcriptional regulator with XRE-family HTH domain
MDPGFRLRQIRERLGLTYRDVQRASLALARVHTRPQFAVHISRLADIENAGVVPSLHKLYALAVVCHLNPLEILRWYDVAADKVAPPIAPNCTEFMHRNTAEYGSIENILNSENGRHRYGCIGLDDRRMEPILRPPAGRLRAASTGKRVVERVRPPDVLC